MEEFVGVTEMEVKVAADTVSVVLPAIAPDVAVMGVEPVATDVASPLLFTVATLVFEELHATCAVKS